MDNIDAKGAVGPGNIDRRPASAVTSIYDYLPEILARQKQLEAEGSEEKDPFFKAPESLPLYDQMMRERTAYIEILAPSLQPTVLEYVMEELGFDGRGFVFAKAARLRMFGAESGLESKQVKW